MAMLVKGLDPGTSFKIPEVLNWEDYRYSPAIECHCGKLNVYTRADNIYNYVKGVAETPRGTEVCCLCPKCEDRIRFHIRDVRLLTIYHPEWQEE